MPANLRAVFFLPGYNGLGIAGGGGYIALNYQYTTHADAR
jgi:hypothetical protein